MSTPELLSLEKPAKVPEAAIARLVALSGTFSRYSEAAMLADYAALLRTLSGACSHASVALAAIIKPDATAVDLTTLTNAGRLALASMRLFEELALREERADRVTAMRWARACREMYHDTHTIQREYAPLVYLGQQIDEALTVASIRLLPGAEGALTELGRDWLLLGSHWTLPSLARSLSRYTGLA